MIRGAFIFVCGIAAGVLVYETALERASIKVREPRASIQQPYAERAKLTPPIGCDATVNGKCYIRGMR